MRPCSSVSASSNSLAVNVRSSFPSRASAMSSSTTPSPTGSSGVMPLILQKPPSGMMPMPYSVSPHVRRSAAGGNPT